tara:strand:+ start:258 stop:758 length:501 start_codon:yes stop_codon:yes gene_type:complete
MRIIAIIIFLMPVMAFGQNTNVSKASVNYVNFDVDDGWVDASVDGWGASFDTAMNDKVIFQLDWYRISEDGVSADLSIFSAGYAFGSLSEGSWFVGAARFDSDVADSAETEIEVGYSKISGDGSDWSISYIDEGIRGEVHTPSGFSIGILTDGDVTVLNLGYHIRF